MVSGVLQIPAFEDDDSDGDEPPKEGLEAATDEICHSISSLFGLTVVIQNLSSGDRLERIEKIDVAGYEEFDIKHVKEKFSLTEEGDFFSERLGKANTKRRQLLKYYEKHHEKLVGRRVDDKSKANEDSTVEEDPGVDRSDGAFTFGRQSNFYSEAPSTMRTTVSTLDEYAFLNPRPTFETDYDDDNQSESGQSGTSYASSSTSETSGANKLRVPDPPNEYDGTEFECSYCFKIVGNITNKIRWQ
jgi:hypothetical protein